ncbi:MAG: T9SS type A sorting domain-containing protein [Dysgonamonadaceae bacterium]|jgi:hypothetical protein|nr:T9SS type A sorting domain-containing protein [Dysgonamonadaceae bacterium]
MKQKIFLQLVLMLSACLVAKSQITWPEGQLLPSFPAVAETQDLIYLSEGVYHTTAAEMYLFSSLKGLINRTQPRIFSYEGDNLAEGAYTWFNALGVKWKEWGASSTWSVLTKYKDEIDGLVVYDPDQIHTVNLAIPIAHRKNALIAAPELLERLKADPYNFPVLEDLRELHFTKVNDIYNYAYDNFWKDDDTVDKRILISLSPENHKSGLREYAVALGTPVVWLDPNKFTGLINGEKAILEKFMKLMPQGANCLGWWTSEQDGVELGSYYGITTMASDYSVNLTFHSGTPRTVAARPMPAKPELQNKIYVAFIISDGDNLQYIEHVMLKLWNNADRGSVPMGWTISPAMVDAMPGALNYYHRTSTDNDNLISGPSGYGYTYPNYWLNSSSKTNAEALAAFVAKTEEYNVKAGIRVITIWNTITGGINLEVGTAFANNSSTLLGLTAQNTGGTMSIYGSNRDPDVNRLPGKPLTCNYCGGVEAMKDHISSASADWLKGSKQAPLFLIIQAENWANSPTTFKEVMNSLNKEYYQVVRPDHIFQLIRERNGLPVNPGGVEGDGDGLTGVYFNGTNFEKRIAQQTDPCINFEWENASPLEGIDIDNFSIRWTGQVMPRYSGDCTFYLTSDDGSRLWINNELLIDKWDRAHSSQGTVSLTAGEKYDLKLEYYDRRSAASCKLEWASPLHSREVVPQSHLFRDTTVTAIKNINSFSGLKAYPSRAGKGLVTVEVSNYNGNDDVSLTVYDIFGKKLLQQTGRTARQQLDLSRYSKGIYLISAQTRGNSKTIRYLLAE